MVDVRPFRALRPAPGRAAAVAAPPYDVVDVAEARALAAGNPDSFLRVTRPELALPDGAPEAAVLAQGRRALAGLVSRGVLVRDETAGVFVYRQRMGAAVQTGVVACAAVADYLDGTIRTHEHTRPDKEDDRVRHIDALDAHDEPVFLLHPRSPSVAALVSAVSGGEPVADFVADDGVAHTVWRASPAQAAGLVAAYAAVPAAYVADGHHRSAAAARVRELRGPGGEQDAFLAVLFAADELTVLPYNRVVADLAGHTSDGLLAALDGCFAVARADAAVEPARRGEFGLYLAGRWYVLRARPGVADAADPLGRLDVSVLQERVLAPLLGIADPRTDQRIRFVGGIRGTAGLERLVDGGSAAAAFSLHPTSTDDLMALADLGEVMPPKSTWFEPKLRSGLLIHPLH